MVASFMLMTYCCLPVLFRSCRRYESFVVDYGIKFNCVKSVAMRIFPRYNCTCADLILCNNPLAYVRWLSGRALDLRFTGRGFNSRPVRFHVT